MCYLNPLNLTRVRTPEPSGKLEDDGRSIRIHGLSAGINYELVVEYELPEDIENAVDIPVLRVDLHRPQSTSERNASNGNAN